MSRLLWDGLIGPSDETWMAGAEALANEPPFPPEIASRVQDSELLDAARAELQTLGRHAVASTDPMARAQTLAQVWGVCAGCHQIAGIYGDR